MPARRQGDQHRRDRYGDHGNEQRRSSADGLGLTDGGRVGRILDVGNENQRNEGCGREQRRRGARREITDAPVGEGEDEREQAAERRRIHDDAGEEPHAALHRPAYQLGLVFMLVAGWAALWACSSKAMARSTDGSPRMRATPNASKPARSLRACRE